MKYALLFCFLFMTHHFFGQSNETEKKFRQLKPDVWLGIWDKENSESKIKIDTLSYDDIPKYLDFRGIVVEALKWKDNVSEKILVQTVTGQFNWKNYEENSLDYMIQNKSELYAYLFEKRHNENKFNFSWKIYDYTECFGVDWFTGFVPKGTTITDVNKDGITEITIPYVLICRGGMDPGTMKIIMYENRTKYALRGSTMLGGCDGQFSYGGEYSASDNLKPNRLFMNFLTKRWNIHKCENGRYY